MDSKICVIGCGWLGFSVAQKLVNLGINVHGSTTSQEKLALLEDSQIVPFELQISSEGIIGNITSCLKQCQTVIINIPPGLHKQSANDYLKQMTHLRNAVAHASVEKVLFIGSTSIYDNQEHYPIITEDSPPSISKKALALVGAEQLFYTSKQFKTTILRFSGLFGEDRHPARFLSGKIGLNNGNAPINLIHKVDCIHIILSILKHNIWNTTFNAATPSHPSKIDYYTSICKQLQLPLPKFDKTHINAGKIIDATKLMTLLNYEFEIKL